MSRQMEVPDLGKVPPAFTPECFVLLAGISAIGGLPNAWWAAWSLGVLWALLVIRGTIAGQPIEPRSLVAATPDLLPLWGRGLVTTAVILLPWGALMTARYAAESFPDSESARSIAGVVTSFGGLLTFVGLLFYPTLLGLAATEIDLHFLVSPRAVRKAARKAAFTVFMAFAGLFLMGMLSALLLGSLPAYPRRLLAWFALLCLMVALARLVGLLLYKAPAVAPPYPIVSHRTPFGPRIEGDDRADE